MTYFDQSNLISQNNLGQISKMATVGSGKFSNLFFLSAKSDKCYQHRNA